MDIVPDEGFTQRIYSAFEVRTRKYEEQKREWGSDKFRIHELVRCPRYSGFKRAGKVVPDMEEVDPLILLRGEALHIMIEQFFVFTEVEFDEEGIVGHIDILSDTPVELYTTNISAKGFIDELGAPLKEVDEKLLYRYFGKKLRQLFSYLHLQKSSYGKLGVLFLNGDYSKFRKPILIFWDVFPGPSEEWQNWMKIKSNKKEIQDYLESGRVKLGYEHGPNTPVEPHFYEEYLGECPVCPYKGYCYSGEVQQRVSEEEVEAIRKSGVLAELKIEIAPDGGIFEIDKAKP